MKQEVPANYWDNNFHWLDSVFTNAAAYRPDGLLSATAHAVNAACEICGLGVSKHMANPHFRRCPQTRPRASA